MTPEAERYYRWYKQARAEIPSWFWYGFYLGFLAGSCVAGVTYTIFLRG